ncbi:hypothetical protein RvY_17509 [Ramazzottius varieornatus]|uniref:Nuclear hormone receptor FTZ-F1 n=1 Tax=Ramazzottius varieornatus TaxID=947166 RepID=A0A1D1W2D1_RAMVA|nr:hypothetical protein RvY_17509 [Ramazzottius varieornatus]
MMNDAYYSYPPASGPVGGALSLGGSLLTSLNGHSGVPSPGKSAVFHHPVNNVNVNSIHALMGQLGLPAAAAHDQSQQSGGSGSLTPGELSDGSGASAAGTDPPDSKVEIDDEICPVCGDKVSGYHYGLLTCESCKGFFKRTVQNKKVYTCVGERTCQIDKSQRKRCPFCRFQKCLEVGMKLEAVRADRMRGGRNKFGPMYKRDRARKLQQIRARHHVHPHYGHHSRGAAPSSLESISSSLMSGGGPCDSMGFEQAFVKAEMIQIPHLSSTNSPESMQHHASSLGESLLNGPSRTAWSLPYPDFNHSDLSLNGLGRSNLPSNRSLANFHPPSDSINHSDGEQQQQQQFAVPGNAGELLTSLVDDRLWQENLYTLLHNETYNQCEVDLFELLSKTLDQCLFSQVEWARNTFYCKDLKVDDQMTLLHHSWSQMLVLEFVYHRLRNGLADETTLPNGQTFNLVDLALLGLASNMELLHNLTAAFRELKLDRIDYACMKLMLLLSLGAHGLNERSHVQNGQDRVRGLLLEHCLSAYPQTPERYTQLLNLLPEIRLMANQGEEYLYYKHLTGSASTTTLLMELLLARRKY